MAKYQNDFGKRRWRLKRRQRLQSTIYGKDINKIINKCYVLKQHPRTESKNRALNICVYEGQTLIFINLSDNVNNICNININESSFLA